MTLFDFAYKNVTRDLKTYLYYFLNCTFAVLIFFLFSVLAFHPSLNFLEDHTAPSLILTASEIVTVIFSFAFISYSVGKFLSARNKQFGLLTILGASKKQLNKLIFFENMIIGFAAIFAGIIFGLVISKLFLSIASKAIAEIDFPFYFPVKAIILTIVVLGCLFLLISILIPKLVRKQQIINLLKSDEVIEKKQKLGITFIVFIISTCILYILNAKELYELSLLIVCLGSLSLVSLTYLLFSVGINVYISLAKNNGSYYKKTNMLALSNILGSLKSTTQCMATTATLYTVAFVSITLMISSAINVKKQVEVTTPYAFMYEAWEKDAPIDDHVKKIEDTIGNLPGYKKLGFNLYNEKGYGLNALVTESDYNKIMQFTNRKKVTLNKDEVIIVTGNPEQPYMDISPQISKLFKNAGSEVSIKKKEKELIIPSGYKDQFIVVPDALLEKIKVKLETSTIYAFDIHNYTKYEEVSNKLDDYFEPLISKHEATIISAYSLYVNEQLIKNLILYIGGILCISFLLAVASFLYSRLYSTLDKDSKHYQGIVKVGLSKKELSRVLNGLVSTIVIIPYVLSLVYMWIFILRIDRSNVVSIVPMSIACTVIFTIIQIGVFIFVQKSYKRAVFNKIYSDM
ncbi:ABC transporter permease [Paraclostridium sp.]|uniref:ABC transporter permease n=1 Tax=Paraclostridium sp. TaxID=2023273 RepID=UPI003F67E77A